MVQKYERKSVLFEGVKIVFRNFEGKERGRYNPEGKRNFAVVLDAEFGARLADDGWNAKPFKEREDLEEGEQTNEWFLPVNVEYKKGRPPRITIVTSDGHHEELNENSVEVLDKVDILSVDVYVNGSPWQTEDKSGLAAYAQTMLVTIEEDPLERKLRAMSEQRVA